MRTVIASALRDAGVANVYTFPPSALTCAQPVVVEQGELVRDLETDAGMLGTLHCAVRVCRDSFDDSIMAVLEVEVALRGWDWSGAASAGGLKVRGVDVSAARPAGMDGSLRYLSIVELAVRVMRDDG